MTTTTSSSSRSLQRPPLLLTLCCLPAGLCGRWTGRLQPAARKTLQLGGPCRPWRRWQWPHTHAAHGATPSTWHSRGQEWCRCGKQGRTAGQLQLLTNTIRPPLKHTRRVTSSSCVCLLLPAPMPQLWGVPASGQCRQIPGGLPCLLALLWHEGRLAWDVQWCPDPSPYIQTSSNTRGASSGSSTVPLQGLLAAALANGDVVVWGVPTVQYLLDCAAQQTQQTQQQQQQQQTPQALSLRLPPVWHMRSAAVGGSLGSCCSWLPTYPHDKLLVGCWDGNVVIWQLSMEPTGEQQVAAGLTCTVDQALPVNDSVVSVRKAGRV